MTSTEINHFFESINGTNCLVIGDLMIDAYRWGKVNRISPEAPVPIVELYKKENRLGGAANVAFNLKSLGANPIVCGIRGNDQNGALMQQLLEIENIDSDGLIALDNRKTTVKTRVISDNQHLLRLDEEDTDLVDDHAVKLLIDRIEKIIQNQTIEVIIFEDYNKGLLSENLISSVIEIANNHNIPTSVDPKKLFFDHYQNVSLFKPNKKELLEGLKLDDHQSLADLSQIIQNWGAKQNIERVLLTLSAEGVLIANKDKHYHHPAHRRDITDVSGAGDTVIAVASLCLAKGLDNELIAGLSNLAGGLVCEKVGVVPIDKTILHTEALKLITE